MCHWAGNASNTINARGDVFGKQAGLVLAEFLLLLSIFPLVVHTSVGLTVLIITSL